MQGTRSWSGKVIRNVANVLTPCQLLLSDHLSTAWVCFERVRESLRRVESGVERGASHASPTRLRPLPLPARSAPHAHAPAAMRRTLYAVQAEHSLELHTPYIVHTMAASGRPFTLVPIMVGALTTQA